MKESMNFIKPEIKENPTIIKTEGYSIEDSASFDVQLESLNAYVAQCEKEGIAITTEEMEQKINELGLNLEELLNSEIKDPEVLEINEEIEQGTEEAIIKKTGIEVVGEKIDALSGFKKMMEDGNSDHKTVLSRIRNAFGVNEKFKFNLSKAAVLTLILFLKFNGVHAEGGKNKIDEKKQNKIEAGIKKTVNLEGGDDKTYKFGSEGEKSLNEKILISATNYFDTDKSELKNQEVLKAEFEKFFASINDTNFEKVIDQDWVFKGSSDERARPLGNEQLTEDRIDSFSKLFDETRSNFDFSNQLSSDKIQKVLDKKTIESYPKGGLEKGVTYLTSLINHETNKNYTADEIKSIKENDKDEYQKLLDKCRYTNFEVTSSMFDISAYDEGIILVDDSESMGETQKNMASELSSLSEDKQITVGYFSSSLEKTETRSNSRDAAKVLSVMKTDGSSNERALSSAVQYLSKTAAFEKDKTEKGERISSKIMYLATDEPLQDANKVKSLLKIAKETNTTVKFLIFYDQGRKVVKMDLNDLDKQVSKVAELKIAAEKEKAQNDLLDYEKREAVIINDLVETIMRPHSDYYQTYGALKNAKIDISNVTNDEKGKELLKNILIANKGTSKILDLPDKTFRAFKDIEHEIGKALHNIGDVNKLTIENQLANNIQIDPVRDLLITQK